MADTSWASFDPSDDQGSVAWHKFRSRGLGSSDAACLLGLNRYKTIHTLWLEKTGQKEQQPDNPRMARGRRLEPVARDMFEKSYGHRFPAMCGIHLQYKFIRASFDGFNCDLNEVLEIKCPGKAAHETAANGKIPQEYYIQVQWLLLVANSNVAHYYSYNENDQYHLKVNADPELHSSLITKAIWFWNLVQEKIPPAIDGPEIALAGE